MKTRDRIVETARRLFAEKGYLATGVAEIRAEAGVHSGSLYHAFPSKQDLLVAVLENYRDHMDERLIGRAWAGIDDPIERIFALLDVYRRFLLESDFLFGCPIGFVALELHDPDEPVRQLVWQNFTNWTARVRECLEAAPLAADADRAALATFVLTTMEGAVMLARTARDIAPFDAAVASLRDYLRRLA
jgi:TetR/AcrR family transcriptional regulator, transcriptional repressor for nem operon